MCYGLCAGIGCRGGSNGLWVVVGCWHVYYLLVLCFFFLFFLITGGGSSGGCEFASLRRGGLLVVLAS